MAEREAAFRRTKERNPADRQLIHRLSLQIINLLPDEIDQAQAVLARASYLLSSWQDEPEAEEVARGKIVSIRPD